MRSFLALLALLWVGPLSAQQEIKPIEGLLLGQLLIGQDVVETGREQLAEVTVRNSTGRDLPLVVKLVITLPNRNIITYGNKRIIAKAYSDTRALIPYKLGQHDGGDYTVAARVFNRAGDIVAQTDKMQEQLFYGLDKSQRDAPPEKRRSKNLTEAELAELEKQRTEEQMKTTEISFDPPDLKFDQVTLINASVLRGETTHVRLFLKNDGGNVAGNVTYSLYWFFQQRPNRKVSFFRDRLRLIAPGERKVLEVPLTIPATEQQGKYQVVAVLDEGGVIDEMDETNNQATSDNQLIFGDVALVFPENNYSFAEEGLFQFEWRSQKYNQFKLQISADPSFTNEEDSFFLPKGDLWTPNFKINPMKGEMPAMGIGLMNTNEVDHLFWRVVAKNSQGKVTESQSRKFFINLKPRE